jgi:hypothetical protein
MFAPIFCLNRYAVLIVDATPLSWTWSRFEYADQSDGGTGTCVCCFFVAWEDGMAGIWTHSESLISAGSEFIVLSLWDRWAFWVDDPLLHRTVKLTPVIVFVCVSCCVYSSSVLCELQVLPLPTLSRDRLWLVTVQKLSLLHFLRYT